MIMLIFAFYPHSHGCDLHRTVSCHFLLLIMNNTEYLLSLWANGFHFYELSIFYIGLFFFFLLICFLPLELWILTFWQLYAFQIYSPRLWLYLFILFIASISAPRVIHFNSCIWYFPPLYLFCILLKKFSPKVHEEISFSYLGFRYFYGCLIFVFGLY